MKGAGGGREWFAVTSQELLRFFGLCLYLGVFRSTRTEDYWDRSGKGPHHTIMSKMSLRRFQQIKRYLRIWDPSGNNGSSFFFNKVEPRFSHIFKTSQKLWFPSSYVSEDEMMVMNYGRSLETVRMRNKPIGSGFKIWALCDNGYTYFAFLHSNRFPWHYCEDYKNVLNHRAAVVARLVETLPRKLPFSRSESVQMYAVFMDNLFSTPKLFALLREKEIAACGTVRCNAKRFPASLSIRETSDKKMNWNTLGAEICANGNVLA